MPSYALGLGEIRVRTALGQSFLAHVDVVGSDLESINSFCIKGKVLTFDGALLANAVITINENANKKSITFISKAHINEPAVKLVVDVSCETKLHREFSILLDPPLASQGANAPQQIDPPVFGMQTLPDLVSNPVKDEGKSSSNSKKQNESKKSTLDIIANDDNQVAPTKKRHKEKSEKSEKSNQATSNSASKSIKPSRDVLKLSDDVLVYPPSQGLRMSDVLSTQTGQDLLVNIEELRAAQAKMAAILRDESAPINNELKPEFNVNQLAEIAQLKQETAQLKKQTLNDQLTIEHLKNRGQLSYWMIFLIAIVACLLAVCAYMFYYIRKNVGSSDASWWEQDAESQLVGGGDVEEIIDDVQESYSQQNKQEKLDKLDSVKNSFSPSSEKQNGNKVDASPNYFDAEPAPHKPTDGRTPTLEETNSSIFNFFSPRGSSVKVEEISDITQEAEFWISMNDPQRAIEILSPQEKIEHPDSPLPWLFLLDLYKTVSNVEKYNILRERFIIFFNANIPEFEAEINAAEVRYLEDFTHIMNHICSLWNDEKIIPYLESLLVDDREGKRMGFELPVYRDILMILGIAHELERIRVIEGQMNSVQSSSKQSKSSKFVDRSKVDPMEDADIHIIEFDTIDFPSLPEVKK